jgi:hypothetical protein
MISDGKPRTFDFGMAGKRRAPDNDRGQPSHCRAADDAVSSQENARFEEVDRVFREWDAVGGAGPFLDGVERDGSASNCWFCVLAPMVGLGIALIHQDIPASERRPATSGRQKT